MKTKNLKNVGCISGASCTFWGSVDDGAGLSTLRGLFFEIISTQWFGQFFETQTEAT
jgi:hypothetical protein